MAHTENTPEHKERGNTLPSPRSRKWAFTLNNYTEDDEHKITSSLKDNWQWIIGKEVGAEGTPHLQGFFQAPNAVSFAFLKKIMPRAHLEVAKGSVEQNFVYCSKEGNFTTNIDYKKKLTREDIIKMTIDAEYKDVVWKEWQQKVLDLIDSPVDKRKIHWFHEPTGNVGKSFLAKWLAMKPDTIVCDGKKDNIFNQVNRMLDEGIIPKVILLDIPRTVEECINYTAIEMLKCGCIYAGKYEGGKCVFPIPHVIAFSNFVPNMSTMSADRWDVTEL